MLIVAGPPGTRERLDQMREVLFPGSARMTPKFAVDFVELEIGRPNSIRDLVVTPYPALHTPETTPTMLRVEVAGKVVTYTGDTDWTDALIPAAAGADLLVSECYFYDKPVKMHMSYATLAANRHRLDAKRVVLTHMGPEMLARASEVPETTAYDGMVIEL